MLPYGYVLLALLGWVVVRHVRSDAPERSKRAVLVTAAGSVLLPLVWPGSALVATVLLIGVGGYVVVYHDVTSSSW